MASILCDGADRATRVAKPASKAGIGSNDGLAGRAYVYGFVNTGLLASATSYALFFVYTRGYLDQRFFPGRPPLGGQALDLI
jgi:hypothetical protein